MTASMTRYALELYQPVAATSREANLPPSQLPLRTSNNTVCLFAQPIKEKSKGSAALAQLINKIESTDAGKLAMTEARQWASQVLHGNDRTLASIRMSRGMSQRQLAEACGMEQPHMSRYESGRNEPGVMVAKRIAEKLSISLDDFSEAFLASKKRLENANND